MTKKLKILFMATTSLLLLSACKTTNDNSMESEISSSEIVAVDSSSQQVQQTEDGYRSTYKASLAQFESGKLDEAAGSIELVLENDLSDYPELKTQATELKTKINAAQAEKVKSDETATFLENSEYKAERVSELAGTEFKAATGQDIKSASDEMIKNWLIEKEAAEKEIIENTTSSSSESVEGSSESASSSSVSSEKAPVISAEEERNKVLDRIVTLTGISAKDNQFYASKEDETNYQVEIRHAHEVDGVEISNMVGMFKYDLSTETLMKMDPLTGEYSIYTK